MSNEKRVKFSHLYPGDVICNLSGKAVFIVLKPSRHYAVRLLNLNSRVIHLHISSEANEMYVAFYYIILKGVQ